MSSRVPLVQPAWRSRRGPPVPRARRRWGHYHDRSNGKLDHGRHGAGHDACGDDDHSGREADDDPASRTDSWWDCWWRRRSAPLIIAGLHGESRKVCGLSAAPAPARFLDPGWGEKVARHRCQDSSVAAPNSCCPKASVGTPRPRCSAIWLVTGDWRRRLFLTPPSSRSSTLSASTKRRSSSRWMLHSVRGPGIRDRCSGSTIAARDWPPRTRPRTGSILPRRCRPTADPMPRQTVAKCGERGSSLPRRNGSPDSERGDGHGCAPGRPASR